MWYYEGKAEREFIAVAPTRENTEQSQKSNPVMMKFRKQWGHAFKCTFHQTGKSKRNWWISRWNRWKWKSNRNRYKSRNWWILMTYKS